jgi:hypothetical protein
MSAFTPFTTFYTAKWVKTYVWDILVNSDMKQIYLITKYMLTHFALITIKTNKNKYEVLLDA